MSCLDQIVTLGACPDGSESTSGFTLLQAPGISLKTLADTANETYMSGYRLAMEKKKLSINQIANDFVGALQRNRVTANLNNAVYDTSRFDPTKSMGNYAGERGIWLHKVGRRSGLRKTFLKAIEYYPLASGEATLKIYMGGNLYSYAITLVANQVNRFDATTAGLGASFPFELEGDSLKVLIDQTTIPFASSYISCKKGCGGQTPNDCGWADGWNGTGAVKSEGYGVNVQFYCECDYRQILCDLSKSCVGELVWLKWRINIMEEMQQSNRFSNFIIYKADSVGDELAALNSQYVSKWNELMDGMDGILKSYRDECLNCRGIRWVTNV